MKITVLLCVKECQSAKIARNYLTVYCPFGANAPRYRSCLPATCYGKEAIKVMGSIGLMKQYIIFLGLLSEIKYTKTMHKMYLDGGIKFTRTGMKNKLFILHGLKGNFYS